MNNRQSRFGGNGFQECQLIADSRKDPGTLFGRGEMLGEIREAFNCIPHLPTGMRRDGQEWTRRTPKINGAH